MATKGKKASKASKKTGNKKVLKAAPKANGAPMNGSPGVFKLSEEDAATLRIADSRVAQKKAELGALVVEFEQRKFGLMKEIEKASSDRASMGEMIAKKDGRELDGAWRINIDAGTLEQVQAHA